jgi:CRP-like cAMP-binding protein
MSNMDNEHAERRRKIESIHSYLTQRGAPKSLVKRIIEYYSYMWSRHIAVGKHKVLPNLHAALKNELDLVLNRKLIRQVPMFAGITTDCLLDLTSMMKSEIYLPQELGVIYGSRGTSMYFIIRGRCEVVIDRRVAILKDGDSFGKRCLLTHEPRKSTVRALVYSELLVLTHDSFLKIIQMHPSFGKNLQKYIYTEPTGGLYGWGKIAHCVTSHKMQRVQRMKTRRVTIERVYRKIGSFATEPNKGHTLQDYVASIRDTGSLLASLRRRRSAELLQQQNKDEKKTKTKTATATAAAAAAHRKSIGGGGGGGPYRRPSATSSVSALPQHSRRPSLTIVPIAQLLAEE